MGWAKPCPRAETSSHPQMGLKCDVVRQETTAWRRISRDKISTVIADFKIASQVETEQSD